MTGDYGPSSNAVTREDNTSWNALPKYYTYGDDIFKQVQPVIYSGTKLELSDQPYNT